jgi:glutaredoxin
MFRRVVLYGKAGCHLCDEARDHLRLLEATRSLEVEEVDITTEPDLYRRYRYLIPVIAVENGPTLAAPITLEQIRHALDGPDEQRS